MVVVRDRFGEFCSIRVTESSTEKPSSSWALRGSQGASTEKKEKGFLTDFFAEVTKIQADLVEAGDMVSVMEKARIDSHQAVTVESEKVCTRRLEEALGTANKHLQLVKARVDRLNEQTNTAKNQDPPTMDPQEIKIRQNMVAALIRKFAQHVRNINTQEDMFKRESKERAIRQLAIAMPETSQSEIIEMVEDGQNTEQVMRQKMIGVHSSVTDALHRVQDKQKDVKKLEKSMNEMHQMFQDMAKLVAHQGDFIDSIGHTVEKANTHVVSGEKEIKKANNARKKMRKYQCCATACVAIALTIFVIAITV